MAIKLESKVIGGQTYVVRQFGALRGRQVLFRLTKLLSPVMAGLAGGLSEEGAARALRTWAESAREEDFVYLCTEFAACTTVQQTLSTGAQISLDLSAQFDGHFAGRYGEMLAWLWFAIGVNYRDFFAQIASEFGASLADLGIRRASTSASQPASTGSSGGSTSPTRTETP